MSAIVRDENTVLPVSTLADGHYGLEGVCLGLPCIVGSRGIKEVLEIPLDDKETHLLRESAKKIKSLINSLNL